MSCVIREIRVGQASERGTCCDSVRVGGQTIVCAVLSECRGMAKISELRREEATSNEGLNHSSGDKCSNTNSDCVAVISGRVGMSGGDGRT